jgi:hypothetical protein
VELEIEEQDFKVASEEPEPDFADLVAMVLNNAGINPSSRLQRTHDLVGVPACNARLPAIAEADEDKVVYEITFDLPNAGLTNKVAPPDEPLHAPLAAPVDVAPVEAIDADAIPKEGG